MKSKLIILVICSLTMMKSFTINEEKPFSELSQLDFSQNTISISDEV